MLNPIEALQSYGESMLLIVSFGRPLLAVCYNYSLYYLVSGKLAEYKVSLMLILSHQQQLCCLLCFTQFQVY